MKKMLFDNWAPTKKMYFDKAKSDIIKLLDEANRQHIGRINIFGFEIDLWKRGIEITKPKFFGVYSVYRIRWHPFGYSIIERGHSTHT